jgi:CHASE2 domain-containing sensor protein
MKFFSWDYIICTLILFAIMLLFPLLFNFKMFDPLKRSLTDFRITDIVDSKIVSRENIPADTNMLLINTVMKNKDLSNLELAKVVHVINQYEPKVIGIKTIIKRSDNKKHDDLLTYVLSQCKNLVMTVQLDDFNESTNSFDTVIRSNDDFTQFADLGFQNFLDKSEERFFTIRSFIPELIIKDDTLESFSAKIAKLYKQDAYKYLKQRNNYSELINYIGRHKFFRMNSEDIIDQNFEPNIIRDKIVLLGRISTQNKIDSNMVLEDAFFTPLNDKYTGKAFPDMYGTVIHANIVSMILKRMYITSIPNWLIFVFSIILVYFNMMLFSYIVIRNKKWYEILSLGIFVIESIVILAITIISFVNFQYEMNLTILIFAIAISILVYELYNSSLKPLTIRMYYKFLHKGVLK